MTSSSIILSNILASESCELKTTIDSYMDTKLKEFQEIMKSKVDSIITDKIDKFYNKSFEEHEKVLFDINGNSISQYNSYANSQIVMGSYKSNFPLYPVPTENKCFQIGGYSSSTGRSISIEFFKTYVMRGEKEPYSDGYNWVGYKHNLSSDCLFAIKYFNQYVNFTESIKVLEEHPEYFKKNCSDFEKICHKEYSEIEKTKSQLKALMDEQITKKDYYVSLEKKIKEIELEKKQLEEDKIKLKEEKEKIVFIKEKLIQMKEEVELEKQKIEQQKNKTVDLDKCFEEIISSKKSKNKQSEKVAFD
jgi:hypothetical protein